MNVLVSTGTTAAVFYWTKPNKLEFSNQCRQCICNYKVGLVSYVIYRTHSISLCQETVRQQGVATLNGCFFLMTKVMQSNLGLGIPLFHVLRWFFGQQVKSRSISFSKLKSTTRQSWLHLHSLVPQTELTDKCDTSHKFWKPMADKDPRRKSFHHFLLRLWSECEKIPMTQGLNV